MVQSIQELWDNYKMCNIYVMRIVEGEEREEQNKCLKCYNYS